MEAHDWTAKRFPHLDRSVAASLDREQSQIEHAAHAAARRKTLFLRSIDRCARGGLPSVRHSV